MCMHALMLSMALIFMDFRWRIFHAGMSMYFFLYDVSHGASVHVFFACILKCLFGICIIDVRFMDEVDAQIRLLGRRYVVLATAACCGRVWQCWL